MSSSAPQVGDIRLVLYRSDVLPIYELSRLTFFLSHLLRWFYKNGPTGDLFFWARNWVRTLPLRGVVAVGGCTPRNRVPTSTIRVVHGTHLRALRRFIFLFLFAFISDTTSSPSFLPFSRACNFSLVTVVDSFSEEAAVRPSVWCSPSPLYLARIPASLPSPLLDTSSSSFKGRDSGFCTSRAFPELNRVSFVVMA
ncbi:hypothetical protein PIB30_026662 [Stylosanthes scabra]|uniref:Transmembrane protein n=1 Tax=Stylosanthes scabra TaxID=79078 RepID=A0ABU6ZBT5_9FABA|nr:hypothetical protein [Stylosanthes scabra]